MKKLNLSQCEDLAWLLWESYDHDEMDDGLPEWGSYATMDVSIKDKKKGEELENQLREQVITYVQSKVNITRDEVESLLNSIYHWRECVVYDERELSGEVKDWSRTIRDAQGKKDVKSEKVEQLRKVVDKMVSTFDESWEERPKGQMTDEVFRTQVIPLMDKKEKWEKNHEKTLVEMGIPKRECHVLIHYGRISKHTEKEDMKKSPCNDGSMKSSWDVRNETYNDLLKKCAKYVK